MSEEWDPREPVFSAEIFCNICGGPKDWVATTEAYGYGQYRHVFICENCDVAEPGYPT